MSNTKKGILAVAGVAVVAAGMVATRGEAGTEAAQTTAQTAAVERRNLEIRAEAAGQIEPIRVVEVKSKASGEVLELHVETGDVVERGALLAEVDPRDVRNGLAQAEADLEVAKARLSTAEAQKQRSAEMRKGNIITQQEFEQAALEEANARAQLIKAQTNLELARERMGDVTIQAPIAGTVIQRSVEVGTVIQSASQNISGGTTLVLMADLSEMQVRMLVDETDIGRIRPGQSARVGVEAYPGRAFVGTVLKIEPQAVVEQNVTMFPVLVRLDNREGLLKPGMNAEAQVEIATRGDAVVVPNAAVVSMRDAAAAAEVLGLDPEAMMQSMRGGARGAGRGEQGAGRGTEGAAAPAAGAASSDCAAVRAKVQGGGFQALSEAERGKARGCMQGMRGGRGDRGGQGAGQGSSDVRPGVVFVQGANGPEPRRVMLGLNDWEYTEVVEGLEPGTQVILMSVARLQQQQEEMMSRFRERAGGPIPGAAGGRRR